MLAAEELTDLYRRYRNEKLLSIYLDTDQHDFAERGKWRLALRNRLAEQRSAADDPEAFDRAAAHLETLLRADSNRFMEGRGWVGFATPDERLYAEALPVPMPNLVRWEEGIRVAPYARALKQLRPVVGVLIDSRRARIVRYVQGRLSERSELAADTYLGDLTDINTAKRASGFSGVRGKTGTDAAQRFLDVERDRLVARVAQEIRDEAGDEAVVVVGGAARTVDALLKEIDDLPEERRIRASGISFDLSEAELRERLEVTASEISARDGHRVLETLIERAAPEGDACLGDEPTEKALREKRVETLVVSAGFRTSRPDRADHLEGAAWDQGADVVEIAGADGDELDRRAGGVGALLRYRIRG